MSRTSRRAFLGQALAATALARSAAAIEPIGRTRPGRLKLSLAAYSYRDLLPHDRNPNPKMDLFGFVDLAAGMGLDAVELTSYYFPPDADTAYLHRLKQHAFVQGLDVSGTSVGNNFCLPPGPGRDKQMELVRTWLDRAAELDAPVIRIFAGTVPRGGDEAEAVAQAIAGIREVLPHAIEKGVALALENHGGITATPAQLMTLVRAIEAPPGAFGVNLDTGNFRTADPYASLAEIAPYAINVQVKTEIHPQGGPAQSADLGRIVRILRETKYAGYVVLEYEAREDPMTAIPRHIQELRSLVG